jgi:muramoyltetrapeptide carboxypeptidase
VRLGLFCPGSPPRAERLAQGLEWLRDHGFAYKIGASVIPGAGLHAGPALARSRDFMELLLDPKIDALLCVRGGSGTLGLLPHLDYEAASGLDKPVIGLSDATALHLALWHRSGLRGISAPVLVQLSSETPAYTAERWLALVEGRPWAGAVPLPHGIALEPLRPSAPRSQELGPRERRTEGVLLPCNLSLLTSMIGTPYLPSLVGAILVLEDVHETPQSLDRMVSQLELSGVARDLSGIVLGQFTDCRPRESSSTPGVTEAEGQALVENWAASLGLPALRGFPYGHEPLCCALPFGERAGLSLDPPGLTLFS